MITETPSGPRRCLAAASNAERRQCQIPPLPSQIYPQISWRFEQALALRFDGNSSRDKILRATLDGVAKHGFHLIHAAIYGELLGFTMQGSATAHSFIDQ